MRNHMNPPSNKSSSKIIKKTTAKATTQIITNEPSSHVAAAGRASTRSRSCRRNRFYFPRVNSVDLRLIVPFHHDALPGHQSRVGVFSFHADQRTFVDTRRLSCRGGRGGGGGGRGNLTYLKDTVEYVQVVLCLLTHFEMCARYCLKCTVIGGLSLAFLCPRDTVVRNKD